MATIGTLTLNPAIDLHCTVDRVRPGPKLRGRDVRREPGGGGVNVARAIVELGGKATAIVAAPGEGGRTLTALLEQEGVTCHAVEVGGETRENVTVHEDESDDQYRFTMPGAALSDEDLALCQRSLRERVDDFDLFVISGSLPGHTDPEIIRQFVRIGREHDLRVVVDTSGEALAAAVEEGPFLVKPNLRELRKLTDRDLEDDDAVVEAARTLIERHGLEAVVASKGAEGAILVTADDDVRLRAPDVEVNSPIGAGDSMVGAFVWRLVEGDPLDEALRWGLAAGAAAVLTPGSELCRAEDVRRLHEDL